MTEKQKFIRYMKKWGFIAVNDRMGIFSLIPSYQKTTEGDHVLIKDITFCLFDGVNTKKGDLGCVTFYYSGKERKKYCKNSYQVEVLKKAFCPKNAAEAIKTFEDWQKTTKQKRDTWKTII